ncbi:hypothetical protein V0288_19980 [Pannus brasiliensis CCIBt3594]|uniref:Uncharacterized protein n=2 Tax=Bacillati TaxID=1783272 RepID=A0AAW9QZZ6_9CHRO
MSQTPITVTITLEEALARFDRRFDKIDERFDKIDEKLENLQKEIADVKIEQAKLSEKIDGLSKRVDNQEFTNRGILIALVVAIIGSVAKLVGLIGNP